MLSSQKMMSAPSGGANYIDDVFSTYLYTGNSTTGGSQTITNNIDLSTKGGMVWIKGRSAFANNNLFDTVRGAGTGSASGSNKALSSNLTSAQGLASTSDYLSAFSTSGFSVTQDGATTALRSTNYNNVTYASWTFRKQAKFFDIVTYTGNGNTNGQNISHSLGSQPGCIIIKATSTTGDWLVYHRSTPWAGGAGPGAIYLNTTAESSTTNAAIGYATSTMFNVGSSNAITAANTNGVTYVAYLFAHNAGGFGTAGTDNVISCGSFTNTTGNSVNLGYEPQWILLKSTAVAQDWFVVDNMRGWQSDGYASWLIPNKTSPDTIPPGNYGVGLTSTGFTSTSGNDNTYIYIAIRRPMKPPTTGTEVFGSSLYTGNDADGRTLTGLALSSPDLIMDMRRTPTSSSKSFVDRLRGFKAELGPTSDGAEDSTYGVVSVTNDSAVINRAGYYSSWNVSGSNYVWQMFKRAPGFFDEVCYTGTGTGGQTYNHNLGVIPELMIIKARTGGGSYPWWIALFNLTSTQFTVAYLNTNDAGNVENYSTSGSGYSSKPTATTFSLSNVAGINGSGSTYVAYLFATVAGVSKVGSYTGTGSTQQINCGFSGGARFVMIKRTDSTGDWYVWDTARGIVSGNDPYLLLNTTDAETTSTDYIDPYSAGFEISSTAPAAINANGGSYIYLAIA